MAKKKQKTTKSKPHTKPLSLYPLTVDEVATVMLHTPPLKMTKKSRKIKGNGKP